jgi:outer membrane protein assembly factor BamD
MKNKFALLMFIACLAVSACGAKVDNGVLTDEYKEEPVAVLYNRAKDFLDTKQYKKAAEGFDEVERQHPYSIWSAKAQLMSAFSYYQDLKYDDALLALDRFIKLHPANEDIAYAYYLRALCYYEQIGDFRKDQTPTKLAMYALQELINRFPESSYAKDARLKIDLTTNNLAGQQMSIGRFYLKKGQYNAAIKRFNIVIQEYQTTNHIEEALYRLVEAYTALGITDEAKTNAAILGYNYGNSIWYKKAYELINETK